MQEAVAAAVIAVDHVALTCMGLASHAQHMYGCAMRDFVETAHRGTGNGTGTGAAGPVQYRAVSGSVSWVQKRFGAPCVGDVCCSHVSDVDTAPMSCVAAWCRGTRIVRRDARQRCLVEGFRAIPPCMPLAKPQLCVIVYRNM